MSFQETPLAGEQESSQPARATTSEKGAGWVRRLSGYVLVYKRNLLIAFVGAILGSVAQVVVPLIERQIVDNVILRHASPLALGWSRCLASES